MIRVVLLTANELRHRFAIAALAESHQLHVVGVVSESKGALVSAKAAITPADQAVLDAHFAQRSAAERAILGNPTRFSDVPALTIEHGLVNSPSVASWVRALRPDVVILYGTSIVKPPLLDDYAGRMINVHLGLSPYYRGAGTNFWPLARRAPECVGATIHLAVAKVDAGGILAQIRPEAECSDRAHELGTKTIRSAFAILPTVIARYLAGRLLPHDQDVTIGRVFRQKDFNADAVRVMWQHFDGGMMEEYLARKEARWSRFPIQQLPEEALCEP